MASLTAHLRRPDDHGRLAFHPECPLCRGERLAGTLPHESLVGRRTQALITTGVVALSTATPTAVLASEPDQEQEGAPVPEQVAADAPPVDAGFDPGGQPTDLPFDAASAPSAPPSPDAAGGTGPLEQVLSSNDVAPVADPGDGTGAPVTAQPLAPSTSEPIPTPPEEAPAAPEPPPSAPVSEAPATTPEAPDAGATAPSRRGKHEATRDSQPRTHTTAPHTVQAAPAPSPVSAYVPDDATAPPTVQAEQSQLAASSSAAANHGRAAQRGDRVHAVRRGESLWSIASDLVGDGASPARVAREVSRLWELNGARIGTGDPDLLMAGTRLALR